jgi:hypothetical protein
MTGPYELLFAYYRRVEHENRALRARNNALLKDNHEVRRSRDKWKEKARERSREASLQRQWLRASRERAEMWKNRALNKHLVAVPSGARLPRWKEEDAA